MASYDANPVFLGFALKEIFRAAAADAADAPGPSQSGTFSEWFRNTSVSAVCSIADCMSPRPDHGRFERWAFNPSGFYDSTALALRDAEPDAAPGTYDLLAFELHLTLYQHGRARVTSVRDLMRCEDSDLPLRPSDMGRFLGFDVASVRPASPPTASFAATMFAIEHSPLSCNRMCAEPSMAERVNPNCLLDRLEDAAAFALRCSSDEPEPGPYAVVGVWKSDPAS